MDLARTVGETEEGLRAQQLASRRRMAACTLPSAELSMS